MSDTINTNETNEVASESVPENKPAKAKPKATEEAKTVTHFVGMPKPTMKYLSVNELQVHNDVNFRFQAGQTIHGIQVVAGTYDLNSMRLEIEEVGGIMTPLVVWEYVEDGKTVRVTLQGNRRTLAGKMIYADPNTSKELKAQLDKVPCWVYKDLSREQVIQLVNDQNSKRFLKSELVNFIYRLNSQGWDYRRIVMAHWRQLAMLTGSTDKSREVEAMTDKKEQEKVIKAWFRSTLEQDIIPSNNLGERIRTIRFQEFLVKDGIIKQSECVPGFKLTEKDASGKTRIACLKALQLAEQEVWNPHTGSPEFNKLIEHYINVDANKVAGDKPKPRPTIETLQNRILQAGQCKQLKGIYAYTKGDDVPELPLYEAEIIRNADVMDAIKEVVNDVKNPEIANLLRLLAYGKDLPEIENVLALLTV